MLPGLEIKNMRNVPIYQKNTFKTWEQGASNAANIIWHKHEVYSNFSVPLFLDKSKLEIWNLREIVEEYIGSDLYLEKIKYDERADSFLNHEFLWTAMAHNAINAIVRYYDKNLLPEDVLDIVIKKQKDYGHKNIEMFGITGLVIRIHDKIARAENILAKDSISNAVSGESLEDTFIDIIGYSIIATMWLNNTFMLELGWK
jgi:hypothetical protein